MIIPVNFISCFQIFLACLLVGAIALASAAPKYAQRSPIFSPLQQIGLVGHSLPQKCGPGLVRKVDGSCVKPIVNKNIFLYNAPAMKLTYGPPPKIPDPAIDYNYVFIRAPNAVLGPKPVVVPPPQQKTLVYVLSEQPQAQQQPVIEVPSAVTEPEVFFINYNEGENPTLPGGIDLRTALSQSAQSGQIIGGGLEQVAVGGAIGGSGYSDDLSSSVFVDGQGGY